jgi:hypothetical protein
LFLPKTILYQDKDTCAIRLGFGHLNEEEIEIIAETGFMIDLKKKLTVMLGFHYIIYLVY